MAVAGERLGIGIQRHFTSESGHPYDEVVWEHRDSRISDYRTGAVAFEQLGVEVPSTWSLNATNILAQKYFRGTVGMPGRESSLRQVVDRVVDTITAWGLKDGYFVDSVEAGIFSDELKHLVVQQKAAFNSPVWFNIGVEGVPQQAAACFILGVEDSMASILNWYVEEGTIFKGGSGAGVNLSNIRSSRRAAQRRRDRFWACELHARGGRLCRDDQVRGQDPSRREDGDPRRRPSGHPRVHLVQGP